MNVNSIVSKDYAKEIVSDYLKINNQVDSIIKQTGYKSKFIAKKLGLPESTFYQKKRNKSFTCTEVKQLVDLMDENDDVIEDAYFAKIHEERKNEASIPLDDVIARFNAKHPEHAVL
jgi:predicted transcriptional regulator